MDIAMMELATASQDGLDTSVLSWAAPMIAWDKDGVMKELVDVLQDSMALIVLKEFVPAIVLDMVNANPILLALAMNFTLDLIVH